MNNPNKKRLRRTMMFLNAQKPGLIKDPYIYKADSLMLDLEDAVAENQKDVARFSLYHALKTVDYRGAERVVRINGLDTPYWREDIRACVAGGCDSIRIPKTEHAEDVHRVAAAIAEDEKTYGRPEGEVLIIAALESARGVMNALEICESDERLDDTTKVEISKTDITGENPVSGALLQIKDKDGNVIHEWISSEDVNYLEADLTAGETYILHEESAPNGFVVSEDVEFTVNMDGTVNKVQMKDDTTKVSITKYDITTGEELPGATLQIIDKDGNVIEEWVSGTEAHLITGILTAGETYTLREISAPDGWTVTEDVTFTVDTDGSITHVEMFDKPTSVSIRKVDASGNDISGAVMQLIDKDGNVIEEWTSDGTAHVLTAKLIAGETYTLHEVSAPAGYELAKDQTFTVDENGETTEVIMVDEKTPTVPVATPTTPASSTASSPKTGDAMPVMAVGTGLLASFILMLLTRKKKRKNKAA